ncbi:hypothetical protein [Methylococcus sp. Mc7]|uniref:hypothetical protein n=1 Tax=Methylococcus sp. Mc7 TaxID=2860258 RepID=UPI001C52B6B1|nr:hypothetical protein [Methylococcus sp. Mc7]QXP83015.1 hypothetical protein KW115_12500 [Methylococcus sp. Mc7]
MPTERILEILESAGARPLLPDTIQWLADAFALALAGEADLAQAFGVSPSVRKAIKARQLREAARLTGERSLWKQAAALSLILEELDWSNWPPLSEDAAPAVRALYRAKRFGGIPRSERQIYRLISGNSG